MKHQIRLIDVLITLFFLMLLKAFPAQGGTFWPYVSQYQLGIGYTSSHDHVTVTYERARSNDAVTRGCLAVKDEPRKETCSLGVNAGASSGFGIFLQQAFKRQGNLYLNLDLGFGMRYLTGARTKSDIADDKVLRHLPVKSIDFQLLAALIKPYLQFGYTPINSLPDILFTIGPTLQFTFGTVTINDQEDHVAIATASELANFKLQNIFWANLEIVFVRFGDGAFSMFIANDNSGRIGTAFYSEPLDEMDNFKASFNRSVGGAALGFGLKLLLNWP